MFFKKLGKEDVPEVDIVANVSNSVSVNETNISGVPICTEENSGDSEVCNFVQKPIEDDSVITGEDEHGKEHCVAEHKKNYDKGHERDKHLKKEVKKISPRSCAHRIPEDELVTNRIDSKYVSKYVKPRSEDVHKGICGKVLIIAGAAGMPGAACLAATAALRSGCGLAYVGTKTNNFQVIQTVVPEAICMSMEESVNKINNFDAVVIGPGMGATLNTSMILENILKTYEKTLIIDADALNAMAKTQQLWPVMHATKAETIITPHLGEAARLLQRNKAEYEDRILMSRQLYMKYGAITVLKGHKTLVYDGSREFLENTTGNPGMATAGSGDVLAGVIAAFAAQGMDPKIAAASGVYIHGRAGDIASEKVGEYSVLARDILNGISGAIKEIVNR